MPQTLKCFCDSTGCAGREVSKRVFDAHSKLDRAAQARRLQAASERILDDQVEALSTYVSSMTLSDKLTGASQHPGGRFWSKSSTHEESTEKISHGYGPYGGVSRHELTDRNLRLLRDIEESLNRLEADAKHQLATIGVPLAGDTPFPLRPLIVAVLNIQNQLVGIKQRISSVGEVKSSLVSKAQNLLAILQHSRSQWMDKAKQCSQEQVSGASSVLNSGMWISLLSPFPF
jgi:hypothetical protein